MTTQTQIFRRLVREHMGAAPLQVTPQTGVGETVAKMTQQASSCAVVADAGARACGIITEQDVVRRIAFAVEPETPAEEVMSAPLTVIAADDYLFHAVAFMRRKGLRHIPVVGADGRICGILSLHEALGFLASPIMELIDRLTHEETLDGLRKVKQAQIELAQTLFNDNVPAPEVQALLSEINIDIHRRVLRRALADMDAEGYGAPPVAFSLIVMGSGGRGENFLFPDQDNGFVLADYPDEEHGRIDPFFIELATRMTRELDEIGLPLCRGNVMATNPVWRKTISQWREQIRAWIGKRLAVSLRLCDIFFDFRHAFGDSGLSAELRAFVDEITKRNPGFLKDMFTIQADHKVALGLFGRLLTESDGHGRNGLIDLKYGGTLPLVEAVRLLALQHGVGETATLARLDALQRAGVVSDNERDYLAGAFAHITALLLRQQIADFTAGRPVGSFVPKDSLSKRERDYLVAGFRAIDELRGQLKSALSGEGF